MGNTKPQTFLENMLKSAVHVDHRILQSSARREEDAVPVRLPAVMKVETRGEVASASEILSVQALRRWQPPIMTHHGMRNENLSGRKLMSCSAKKLQHHKSTLVLWERW